MEAGTENTPYFKGEVSEAEKLREVGVVTKGEDRAVWRRACRVLAVRKRVGVGR